MWRKEAVAAKQALALDDTGLFFLLKLMTALLGFVLAILGAAFTASLLIYQAWQLDQRYDVRVSLLGDTPGADVVALQEALATQPQVQNVARATDDEIYALLAPVMGAEMDFPAPKLLTVTLKPTAQRERIILQLEEIVLLQAPTALMEDNYLLLARVAELVRASQTLVIGVGLMLLVVMAGLVMVTVWAGIQTQKSRVAVLKFLGGTDAFIVRLVVRQIVQCALVGWIFACFGFALGIGLMVLLWPASQPWLLLPAVWSAGIGAAGGLVVLTYGVAKLAALRRVMAYG